MSSKKQKQVYNIENINMEIDYARLAEEIEKATKKANQKEQSNNNHRIKLMSFINGVFYISIASFCFYGIYQTWHSFSFKTPTYIVIRMIITIFLGAFGVMMFLSQQESLHETKEESKEFFNSNVTIIALIIALIALFHSFN